MGAYCPPTLPYYGQRGWSARPCLFFWPFVVQVGSLFLVPRILPAEDWLSNGFGSGERFPSPSRAYAGQWASLCVSFCSFFLLFARLRRTATPVPPPMAVTYRRTTVRRAFRYLSIIVKTNYGGGVVGGFHCNTRVATLLVVTTW